MTLQSNGSNPRDPLDLANRLTAPNGDIVERVTRVFNDSDKLRQRMDRDYDRWRLVPFKHKLLTGYEVYTSNEPRTFARKAIALLNTAQMTVRCPQDNDPRVVRDQDNAKEQFAIGNLKANDERLVRMGLIPLRRTMAFHTLMRGWTTGRCVMAKRGNRVWADATPWDPREVAWEYGPDGLDWICRRYAVLSSAAEREWKIPPITREQREIFTVYDYYDSELNTVLIPGLQNTPVKQQPHGTIDGYREPIVPGWCIANPMQPLVQASSPGVSGGTTSQLGDALEDYGESIMAENRATWDTHDYNMSILKNLVGRSLKPVFGIESESGVKLVEGDPWATGSEIPLRTGEKLVVYDFLKSAADTLPYMTINQGEMQRGSFPVIMHGETPATISGFGMTVLKSGPADKVMAAAEAMELALKTITNIWADQFVSGAFGDSLKLSGVGGNRKWFVADITPDMLRDLPALEINLKPQLPEDDAGKIQQAVMLRQPGITGQPLLSDYDIREKVLERQNSDQDVDTIMQEMAAVHPLVQAQRMTDALAKRGDEGAGVWFAQYQMLLLQAMQSGFPPPGLLQAPNRRGNGTSGFSPEVAPNAVQGNPPPTPGVNTPGQAGPLVPPGTPRPGAVGQP